MNKNEVEKDAIECASSTSDEVIKNSIYEKEINLRNVVAFTVPTIVRMIFISMYSIVDGIVVANYVGSMGLSAINIVYPVMDVSMALAFMFAMGGSAIVGKKLGEGKRQEANSFLSILVIINLVVIGILLAIFFAWDEEIFRLVGSDDVLLPYCIEYGVIVIAGAPLWVLQVLFQNFLVAADKPKMGLCLSIIAGIINVGLDILLVGVWGMGLKGAAIASVMGMTVGGLVPLTVFFNKKSILHFEKPKWFGSDVAKAIGNGSSEMITSLTGALTGVLLNIQLMAYMGEKGVAAMSSAFYIQFIFIAVFFGFSSGIAPVYSFNYGAENMPNIRKLFKISMEIIGFFAVLMFGLAEIFTKELTLIFASKDAQLFEIMVDGLRIFAFSILFSGLGIFGSSFFTALNDGKRSALISLLRIVVLEIPIILILPKLVGPIGLWWAIPLAEALGAVIVVIILIRNRKTYGY